MLVSVSVSVSMPLPVLVSLSVSVCIWDQSPAEKIHLKFCKHYLELNRKASNSATRSELGRLPIQITLVKKSLKYYSYLCGKDQNTIVKQAFLTSKDPN